MSWLIDNFLGFFEFILEYFNFIFSVMEGFVKLASYLPSLFHTLLNAVNYLPNFVAPFAFFTVAIAGGAFLIFTLVRFLFFGGGG